MLRLETPDTANIENQAVHRGLDDEWGRGVTLLRALSGGTPFRSTCSVPSCTPVRTPRPENNTNSWRRRRDPAQEELHLVNPNSIPSAITLISTGFL